MLRYYPRHVSSINMPIFRRTNYIHTASGIIALCKRLHSTPVESGLQSRTVCSQWTSNIAPVSIMPPLLHKPKVQQEIAPS